MKLFVVFLLIGAAFADSHGSSCNSNCDGFPNGCACDALCPTFEDCCDDVMAECGYNPDSPQDVDMTDDIFDIADVQGHFSCDSELPEQTLANMDGTNIYRMHVTEEDVAANYRYTIDVCDFDHSLEVSVLKPIGTDGVEEQCDLEYCSCTFQTSQAGAFYVVVYSIDHLVDETDTDPSTYNYHLGIECAAVEQNVCDGYSSNVAMTCPTAMDGANECITVDGIDGECCDAFVEYSQKCAETVSADAGFSTECNFFEGDDVIALYCSAEEVVEFSTTLAGVSLEDITEDFVEAFLAALAETMGINRASLIVSRIFETTTKQGGATIETKVIPKIAKSDGTAISTASLTTSVNSLDTTSFATNLNTELSERSVETTIQADDLDVSEPVIEEAVVSPSSSASASTSPSGSPSPSMSAAVTPSASTTAAATASSSPTSAASATPSTTPDECNGLSAAIDSACLTNGCLDESVAVGDNCCDAVNTYVQSCSGYSFDQSCNNSPASVAAMYSANCLGSSTSAASTPAMLAAAVLAVLAFAMRA